MSRTLKAALENHKTELDNIIAIIIQANGEFRERNLKIIQNKLVKNFNSFSIFGISKWRKVSLEDQSLIRSYFLYFVEKTEAAIRTLNLNLVVPTTLGRSIVYLEENEDLDETLVLQTEEELQNTVQNTTTDVLAVASTSGSQQQRTENLEASAISDNNLYTRDFENESTDEDIKPDIMVLSMVEFLKLGATLVPTYNGEPEGLTSFLDAIDLLNSAADGNDPVPFLKTRLGTKARNWISPTITTVDAFKDALKNNVKSDDSDLIKARLTALNCNKMQLDDFAVKAEELASKFQLALTMEVGSADIAKKQTHKELVKLCRNNARTDLAKAIIASSSYETPKDILTKFVTEVSEEKNKMDILYVNHRPYRGGRGRVGNFQNYNSYQGSRYNDQRRRNNFQQGRGRNFNRGYSHRRPNPRNQPENSRGSYNNRPQRYIRYTEAEPQGNESHPQTSHLGDESTD